MLQLASALFKCMDVAGHLCPRRIGALCRGSHSAPVACPEVPGLIQTPERTALRLGQCAQCVALARAPQLTGRPEAPEAPRDKATKRDAEEATKRFSRGERV